MATFGIHFDGPITVDHKVTIRVLAKTYEHMQRAIDRAYLIDKYGEVWKHARLKYDQYQETDFIAEYPREGGIILNAVRKGGGVVIDRIAGAIRPVFEGAVLQGLAENKSMEDQILERREYVDSMGKDAPTYEQLAANPPARWATAYSNRSIIKEVDQLVAQITPARLEGSTVDVELYGQGAHLPFKFDACIAARFHTLSAQRDLGAVIQVSCIIRSLDRGNRHTKPSAKVENTTTGREVSLQLSSRVDFDALHPHHNGQEVRLFVCPIVEALGFDLNGGDLMFLSVA